MYWRACVHVCNFALYTKRRTVGEIAMQRSSHISLVSLKGSGSRENNVFWKLPRKTEWEKEHHNMQHVRLNLWPLQYNLRVLFDISLTRLGNPVLWTLIEDYWNISLLGWGFGTSKFCLHIFKKTSHNCLKEQSTFEFVFCPKVNFSTILNAVLVKISFRQKSTKASTKSYNNTVIQKNSS